MLLWPYTGIAFFWYYFHKKKTKLNDRFIHFYQKVSSLFTSFYWQRYNGVPCNKYHSCYLVIYMYRTYIVHIVWPVDKFTFVHIVDIIQHPRASCTSALILLESIYILYRESRSWPILYAYHVSIQFKHDITVSLICFHNLFQLKDSSTTLSSLIRWVTVWLAGHIATIFIWQTIEELILRYTRRVVLDVQTPKVEIVTFYVAISLLK